MESSIKEMSAIQNAAALNASQDNKGKFKYGRNCFGPNRCMIAVIVYLALLLDNILLTVIVPILPDYLAFINNRTLYTQLSPYSDFHYISQHKFFLQPPPAPAPAPPNSQTTSYHHPVRHMDGIGVVSAKHPIPGKSMINFSTLRPIDEQSQQQQQYLTINENDSNSTDIIKIVSNNNNTNKSLNKISTSSKARIGPSMLNNSPSTPTSSSSSDSLADENGSIGLLLSIKALVQLIFNPIVGNLSSKLGYRLPIVMGTFCLFVSSLVFSVGETYIALLVGRAVQGIGSACIGVCGMSLVAQNYPEEDRRSKVMGVILGSIALGVLIGYPFGGFLYDLSGKSAPFMILSTLIFLNLGMQLVVMDLSVQPEVIHVDQEKPKWKPIFQSKMILAIIVAIWFSTSTMAILEPCLPIWLMQTLKPTKWQLGTVFIPDSVGYFVGTNFFGSIAYNYGQVKISCMSLILVGISAIMIPTAKSVGQLLVPHFCLGLGIGIIDAALVPLLATFVDATLSQDESVDSNDDSNSNSNSNSMASYGTVYCLQQTSVSLAYCLAPLIGGELAETFGFIWLMRIVGFFNLAYGPILVYLYRKYDPKISQERHNEMLLMNTGHGGSQYKQLYNSVDME